MLQAFKVYLHFSKFITDAQLYSSMYRLGLTIYNHESEDTEYPERKNVLPEK